MFIILEMEPKKSIILQVDESTKRMMSEVEDRISEGYAESLENLRNEIRFSAMGVESLKAKLLGINDALDSLEESSRQFDLIKKGVEDLNKMASTYLDIETDSESIDEPLKKRATRGDIEDLVKRSIDSIGVIRDTLLEHIQSVNSQQADSLLGIFNGVADLKTDLGNAKNNECDHYKDIVGKVKASSDNLSANISESHRLVEELSRQSSDRFDVCNNLIKSQSLRLVQHAETLKSELDTITASLSEYNRQAQEEGSKLLEFNSNSIKQIGASIDSVKTDMGCLLSDQQAELKKFQNLVISHIDSFVLKFAEIDARLQQLQKENRDNYQLLSVAQTEIKESLKEVLYYSMPFWRFRARKRIKSLIA